MSAVLLIEAVQRAGGAITLRDDRLRLSAPKPLPEHLVQELRQRKAELLDHLRHAARSALRKSALIPGKSVESWANGVARLREISPPRSYPTHAWQQLIGDAESFLENWAPQGAALGWPGWSLFGCHRRAPWGRIQGMGLVLLLRGDEIAALTATEAAIRTWTGARQTYRRKPADPLHPAERCLVWELS
jgi:TubC N-terminal docking domain